jgi:feruloyl esterase
MKNSTEFPKCSTGLVRSVAIRSLGKLLGIAFLASSFLFASSARADTCSNLKNTFSLPHLRITSAETVPAGSFKTSNSDGRVPVSDIPAFCRAIGTLAPVHDSQIAVEVWMPISGWNGKLQAIGNHELGGVFYYGDMATELKRNFAVASTDTGHTDIADANWAIGHPEKVVDFGWRAVHEMTVTAKAIISAFYGSNPRYSYFNGCSSGGREALKGAQKFPADYDGIISGSAMNYWTHSHVEHIYNAQTMLQDGIDGAHFLPREKHKLVIDAALNYCRNSDTEAVTDGFLTNPSRCDWKPRMLVCRAGQDAASCITPEQSQSLDKLFSPLLNPKTNEEIYPASMETIELTNPQGLTNGPAAKYFAGLVFEKPDWSWKSLNYDSDVAFADEKDAKGGQINAIDPDLRAFQARGGKLIGYHGWVDPNFTAAYAVEYYESVVHVVGKEYSGHHEDGGLAETQNFYRFFVAPGMGHCTGGPGPNAFGGLAQPVAPLDPQHDLVSAIQEWVERGVAPAQIIATKFVGDDPSKGIAMQRPLCPYPQEAHYKGAGSTGDPANFECVTAARNLKPPVARKVSEN